MASNNPGNNNAIAGAITYPASNSQMQPVPEQPRQPRTLQGLLRFAMEATKAEDAPGNSELGPMDEERRRFLNEALNAQTVQVTEILRKNINILSTMDKISCIGKDDQLPEEILVAFQELGEYIDDIDVANDFDKLGGFRIFPMCYSCDSIELHRWANLTLALVCQNNPRCQARALECGLMPVLLHRLQDHQEDDRSLRALSCMVRNFEPGTRAFVAQGGCDALAACLRAGHAELGSAAFLVTYLCRNCAEARDIFIKNDTIPAIVDILKGTRSDTSFEYLLNILVTLLEQQPADVIPIYRHPALELRKILENHLEIPDVKNGRFIEEKEYCEKIIELAFGEEMNGKMDNSEDVEPADR